MIIQFLLLAATYGIQMRGNLIDKSELVDEALPAASVPGNGTDTTYRLDANSRTAMWAIHEGYLQRALAGAANADAATPWGASTNLLSRQARSARLVRPGTQPLAGLLGNPNLDIGRFEQAFHPSGSSGLIWSSSHFADGTWPGVNARPELPTGNYNAAGIEALATNAWPQLFSPIQRLASATGECNQVAKQFFDNCYVVSGGAITKPGDVYGHWEGAYLLPTNDNALVQALEHPGYRLNKRELEALNTVSAPLDILCQYGDNGGALKTMFEFEPTVQLVKRSIGYQISPSNYMNSVTIDHDTETVTVPQHSLFFGDPYTNSYSYTTISNGLGNLQFPQIAVLPKGGRVSTQDVPPLIWDIYPNNVLDVVNEPFYLYNNGHQSAVTPPNDWECTYSLDWIVVNGIRGLVARLYGTDKDGNYHDGDRYIPLKFSPHPESSPIFRVSEISAEILTTTIGDYDASRSSNLVQQGYLPAEPSIRQWTQGAKIVNATNGTSTAYSLATASSRASPAAARGNIKTAWRDLLRGLQSQFQGNTGYNVDDPSTILGAPPEVTNNVITLTGTGHIAYSPGNALPLYHTNYLARLTGPGVECSAVFRWDGSHSDATLIHGGYTGFPQTGEYEANAYDDMGGALGYREEYSTSTSITKYPAGWPSEYKAEFEQAYRANPRGWSAETRRILDVSVYVAWGGNPYAGITVSRDIYGPGGRNISCGSDYRDVSGEFQTELEVHSLIPYTNPAQGSIRYVDGWPYVDDMPLDYSTTRLGKMTVALDAEGTEDIEIPAPHGRVDGECRMYYIQTLDFSDSSPGFSNYIEPGE